MLLMVWFFCAIPGLSGFWALDPPGTSANGGRGRQPSPEGVQTDADVDPPDPDTGRSPEVPPVSHWRTAVGSLFSSYLMASLKELEDLWYYGSSCSRYTLIKGFLYINKNVSINSWLTIYINYFVLHMFSFSP